MAHVNDIVLIHLEDKPISFARIERIEPDVKHGWFRVKLFILQVPLQSVTWILRDSYINGAEFTMSGKRMRLEPAACPEEEALSADPPREAPKTKSPVSGGGKIIDLKSLMKKR